MWRVGRQVSPVHFSKISPIEAALKDTGNRYDVPGGAVLYVASEPTGCYAETLARLRPSPRMRLLERDEEFMLPGAVPWDWRSRRRLVRLRVRDALPFLDVEATETHTFLNDAIGRELAGLGLEEGLNVSSVRGSNRLVTRAIAEWAYLAADDDGALRYSGVRYMSKLGDYECWAVFDGADCELLDEHDIDRDDPALQQIARAFDLTIQGA